MTRQKHARGVKCGRPILQNVDGTDHNRRSDCAAAGNACRPDLKSRLRLHQQFASRLVDEKHDFIVYLPPMYDAQPDRRFPVLFMQDGQNLFDPETSFIKGNYWRWARPPTS